MTRARYLIVPVVEGHGEVTAVPAMVRSWLRKRGLRNFDVHSLAVRAAGAGALKAQHDTERELGIERYIMLALAARPDAILVILDADDECIRRAREGRMALGPELLARARAVSHGIPTEVVVANREFEAWFLADCISLKRKNLFLKDERVDWDAIETQAGCKSAMARMLGYRYEETTHQSILAQHLSFGFGATKRSRSYAKLLRSLDTLVRQTRARFQQASRANPMTRVEDLP